MLNVQSDSHLLFAKLDVDPVIAAYPDHIDQASYTETMLAQEAFSRW